jgi:hypothetical protein
LFFSAAEPVSDLNFWEPVAALAGIIGLVCDSGLDGDGCSMIKEAGGMDCSSLFEVGSLYFISTKPANAALAPKIKIRSASERRCMTCMSFAPRIDARQREPTGLALSTIGYKSAIVGVGNVAIWRNSQELTMPWSQSTEVVGESSEG